MQNTTSNNQQTTTTSQPIANITLSQLLADEAYYASILNPSTQTQTPSTVPAISWDE